MPKHRDVAIRRHTDKNRLAVQDALVIKLFGQGLNGVVIAERLQVGQETACRIIRRLKAEGRLGNIGQR